MAKILIIDDDRFWRLALKTMLDSQGHEVIEATTGLEGESALAASNIDLVFTDIFMPDQDGLQTIINIRGSSLFHVGSLSSSFPATR